MDAYCTARVLQRGELDVEADYLPHVVQCENGNASAEALRAQAVAARTYLYYKLESVGAIADGQSDQVYSCPTPPKPEVLQAVASTSGQYLSYHGKVLAAFYVAGSKQDPPECKGRHDAPTEKYVTYNAGLTGADAHQSPLGAIDPSNKRNRGCLSQWGSRCLASTGLTYPEILTFYYARDISIESAAGPCILPLDRPPKGQFDEISCERISGWAQDPDIASQPISVWLSFDGPYDPSEHGRVTVRAADPRKALCHSLGSCHHGFETSIPRWIRDDTPHAAWLYALSDVGGAPVLLAHAPIPLHCSPEAPPRMPGQAVLRPVDSAAAWEAWGFETLTDMGKFSDREIADYAIAEAWPEKPALAFDQQDKLWLLDRGYKRQVSARAATRYRLSASYLQTIPQALLDRTPTGPDLPAELFLMKGQSERAYVLDMAR